MNLVLSCSEIEDDKLMVTSSQASGGIWFQTVSEVSNIDHILLSRADARKLAHAILAEVGDAT